MKEGEIQTLWKSSNCTEATAPLTREAMALQASPTKSGTENRAAASAGSAGDFISKCLKKEREREGEKEGGKINTSGSRESAVCCNFN